MVRLAGRRRVYQFVASILTTRRALVLLPYQTDEAVTASSHPPFCIDVAQSWLKSCLGSHDKCQAARLKVPQKQLPTRLLEIGAEDIRVVHTIDFSSAQREALVYATLSHCWGDAATNVLKLEASTIKRLERGVAISEIGRTFGEAVAVARDLGIRFIWIDSLCIQQDSDQDWLSEGPRMIDVYGGALLNIAATAAVDTNRGLFSQTSTSVGPTYITAQATVMPNGPYDIIKRGYQKDVFSSHPLMSRAWVFQELFLASRTLHFCQTEMVWECEEMFASETYPAGMSRTNSNLCNEHWIPRDIVQMVKNPSSPGDKIKDHKPLEAWESILQMVKNPSSPGDKIIGAWGSIVEKYSACNLTFESDKFVAISGVVKLFKANLQADYWAGLWKQGLAHQLGWHCELSAFFGPERPRRPKELSPPTWSWASVNHRAFMSGLPFDPQLTDAVVTVENCDIESRTEDETVDIRRALLRLTGFLKTARLVPLESTGDSIPNGFPDGWNLHVDGVLVDVERDDVRFDGSGVPTDRLHVLALTKYNWDSLLHVGKLRCLLLYPTGETKGHFYRAGIIELKPKPREPGTDSGCSESWLEYESRKEDGRYTVVIE
ncbi:hypothetical protein RB595_000935 [Gaeumannomyces hyphopodioides]